VVVEGGVFYLEKMGRGRTAIAAHGVLKRDVCEHIARLVKAAPEADIIVDLAGRPCRLESLIRGEISGVEERRPPPQFPVNFDAGVVKEPIRVAVLARYKEGRPSTIRFSRGGQYERNHPTHKTGTGSHPTRHP
jgi:hypothetical protein